MSPGVAFVGCPAADSVDSAGAAGTDCVGDSDHDSTEKVVLGTFAESFAASWCVDGYYL